MSRKLLSFFLIRHLPLCGMISFVTLITVLGVGALLIIIWMRKLRLQLLLRIQGLASDRSRLSPRGFSGRQHGFCCCLFLLRGAWVTKGSDTDAWCKGPARNPGTLWVTCSYPEILTISAREGNSHLPLSSIFSSYQWIWYWLLEEARPAFEPWFCLTFKK